jgi:hypothetical protein
MTSQSDWTDPDRQAVGASADHTRLFEEYGLTVGRFVDTIRELAGGPIDHIASVANPQRPLWASTGVKNPDYSPILSVAELVAPGTVNTMPEATLDALGELGIDLQEVTDLLEEQGVAEFADRGAPATSRCASVREAASANMSESLSTPVTPAPWRVSPWCGSRSCGASRRARRRR